jgi:hypothetical protein
VTTASALLLRARDPTAAGRRELVAEAEPLVTDGLERCHLATAWAQLGERALAASALAATAADAGEVRVARNAARIHRTLLGDPAAGARTLAACAAELLPRDAAAVDWRLLAAGWREAGDRDAALYYLAHAAATAATAEELGAVSAAYADAGDLDAARATAARAGAAADSVHAWAAVAAAYDELTDLDGVAASLVAGEARIASADDAAAMATAYASHRAETADVERCIARGHALAGDNAGDGELLQHVRWSLDYQLAERTFTTPGYDEERRQLPGELLRRRVRSLGWPHAPHRLLDRLRARMTPETLRSIAGNDPFSGDDHLAALEAIAHTGRVPHPLRWAPHEAISLERWANGTHSPIDHLGRAFACAILCIEDGAPCSSEEGNAPTLAVLLESCIALGTAAVDDLVALLAAMADSYTYYNEMRIFTELALVLAAAWLDPSDPRLPAAATRLVHEETRRLEHASESQRHHGWLLRLTHFDLRHDLWRSLARSILTPATPELRQLPALLLGAAPG